jgi:deoxyribonuclease V
VDATFGDALVHCVDGIPRGGVASCSTIARALGDVRAARAVATWVTEHPETPKGHRVVRMDGRPVLEGATSRLKAEGVATVGGRVHPSRFVDPLREIPFLNRLREEQRALASKVIEEDGGPIRSVTGVDIAYRGEVAYAAAVTLDLKDLRAVEAVSVRASVDFPYIPSYLAFREIPGIEAAVRRLSNRPEAILIDGHGRLHPALFGVACQAGVRFDLPTIGVAKHPLVGRIDAKSEERLHSHTVRVNGEIRGYAWTPPKRQRPIYVSIGHRVSLPTALALVQRTTRDGYPEPLRIADRLAGERKRNEKREKGAAR